MGINQQMYRDMFFKVENTLRKASKVTKDEFDSAFSMYKKLDIKQMSDKDIFWKLVEIIFYSGFNATTVFKRISTIRKYLYDFEKVKSYTEQDINQILNDPKMIKNRKKVEACVKNAKTFHKLIQKYGSFVKYVESFGNLDDDSNLFKLRDDLIERFEHIQKITANHFLMDLGFNVLKPDRVICRIFSRLDLIKSEKDVDGAVRIGRRFAQATGYPIRYIDIIFVSYGLQGGSSDIGLESGICLEKNPKCHICGVKEYCKFSQSNNNTNTLTKYFSNKK